MLEALSLTKTGFSLWNTITVGKKLRNIYMTHKKYIAPIIEWKIPSFVTLQFESSEDPSVYPSQFDQ